MRVTEPGREIEVLDSVDVLVAGAGVSGCAAATAAARAGARTVVVERNGFLGGIATGNMISNIVNHFVSLDGRFVLRGFAKELMDRLVARGGAHPNWASHYGRAINDAEQMKVVLIEMLRESGVSVLTHTLACRPLVEGQRVTGVFVETKMGRQAILAKAVVDATGEADLAYQAGCPMRWGGGLATLTFKMANVDLEALYQHFKRHPETFPVASDSMKGFEEFENIWLERGGFYFPHGGGWQWDIYQDAVAKGELAKTRGVLQDLDVGCMIGVKGLNTVDINSFFWHVKTLNTMDVSQAELDGQQTCFYLAEFYQTHVPGFERSHLVQLGAEIGIRNSRLIEGEVTLGRESIWAPQPILFDDVVGCVPAKADYQETGEFKHAHTVDIPYRVMLPKRAEGLIIGSGKSVSCVPPTLLRVQSDGMLLGQAAGVAAALAARLGTTPTALDRRILQHELLSQEVFLGSDERLRELGLS